jgi:Planctomycete cytochrome C
VFGSLQRWVAILAILAAASAQTAGPTPGATNAGALLFQQQIQPVLEKQCVMCHGGQLRKGGLDLSSREALLRGGTSGPAIEPGNAKASLLYKLMAHEQEPAMPYKTGKLPDEPGSRIGSTRERPTARRRHLPHPNLLPSTRTTPARRSLPRIFDRYSKRSA